MSSPVIGDASKTLSTGIQIILKIKRTIHIHTKCIQIIFACPHENTIKNDGNVINDVFMMYDIIVFENLCFCPSTRKKGWCFQRLQPWRAFLKRCVFGDCFHQIRIRVDCRPNRRKNSVCFQTKTWVWMLRPLSNRKWNPCYSLLAYCTDLHSRLSYII